MVADGFVTVARLRAEMADVLAALGRDRGPLYLTQRGQPRAVLLDVEEYRGLLEQLEHLDDSIEALLGRDRRDQRLEATRALADVIRARRGGSTRVKESSAPRKASRPRARVPR